MTSRPVCFVCGGVVRAEERYVVLLDPGGSGQIVVAHREHLKTAANASVPPAEAMADG